MHMTTTMQQLGGSGGMLPPRKLDALISLLRQFFDPKLATTTLTRTCSQYCPLSSATYAT